MTRLNTLAAAAVILVLGCDRTIPLQPAAPQFGLQSAPSETSPPDIVRTFISDVNGNPPSGGDTPLYLLPRFGHAPILAPDGQQVTLGEWEAVQGQARVKCVESGTHTVLHVSGLIPKGVYTIWQLVFKAPGFDGTFTNLVGVGALGENDGSQNVLRASETGEGQVSAISPSGPLSALAPGASDHYSIAGCALTGEFEVHYVGAYHLDSRTYGPVPGARSTFAEQFGFRYMQ